MTDNPASHTLEPLVTNGNASNGVELKLRFPHVQQSTHSVDKWDKWVNISCEWQPKEKKKKKKKTQKRNRWERWRWIANVTAKELANDGVKELAAVAITWHV